MLGVWPLQRVAQRNCFPVQVETVLGVHNGASSAINITALAGSLNNAKAFSQHFQNFSAQVTILHTSTRPGSA